jgi:hypothetical protein
MGVFIAGRALLQAQSAKRDMGVSGELVYICMYINNSFWMAGRNSSRRTLWLGGGYTLYFVGMSK